MMGLAQGITPWSSICLSETTFKSTWNLCRLYVRRGSCTPVSLTRLRCLIHGQRPCHMDIQVRLYSPSSGLGSFEVARRPKNDNRSFRYGLRLSEVRRIPLTYAYHLFLTAILRCATGNRIPVFVRRSCPFSILSSACKVSIPPPLILLSKRPSFFAHEPHPITEGGQRRTYYSRAASVSTLRKTFHDPVKRTSTSSSYGHAT
jgi:hypothetical protein